MLQPSPLHTGLPLSWTKIKTRRVCALNYRRAYIDRAVQITGAPAETGLGFHELAEAHPGTDASDETKLLAALTRKAAVMDESPAADLRSIVRRVVERGGLPGLPADATDVAEELAIALTRDGRRVDWDSKEAFFRCRIDRFYRENGGSLAVVRDWKTARVVDDPDDQGRFYAWAVAVLFPDVEEVVVEFYFVRFSMRPRTRLYDAEELRQTVPAELDAIAEDLATRAAADDWPARVSDHCRVCSFVTSCPKFKDRISPFLTINSEADARTAAEQLAIVSGQKSALEKALKGWCLLHGSVDCGDEVLGFIGREKQTVPDALQAFRWFKARGLDGAEIWLHLSLGKTALSKLVTKAIASVPRKERREAREAMEAELLEAGVLEATTGSSFRRRGKKVEAEADEDEQAED